MVMPENQCPSDEFGDAFLCIQQLFRHTPGRVQTPIIGTKIIVLIYTRYGIKAASGYFFESGFLVLLML
jgi:hypothetical protein